MYMNIAPRKFQWPTIKIPDNARVLVDYTTYGNAERDGR